MIRDGAIRRASLLVALLFLGACGWGSETARLRIANVGSAPIRNLTVLFPEEQVHFGDVAVGATSTYVMCSMASTATQPTGSRSTAPSSRNQ